jgi:hypothetical protein
VKEQLYAQEHLDDPRTRKWMVQCSGCGIWGYRADVPEKYFGKLALEPHFEPLSLDARGLCQVCQRALDKRRALD